MGLQEEVAALYETDFYEWTQRNGELLVQGVRQVMDDEFLTGE